MENNSSFTYLAPWGRKKVSSVVTNTPFQTDQGQADLGVLSHCHANKNAPCPSEADPTNTTQDSLHRFRALTVMPNAFPLFYVFVCLFPTLIPSPSVPNELRLASIPRTSHGKLLRGISLTSLLPTK